MCGQGWHSLDRVPHVCRSWPLVAPSPLQTSAQHQPCAQCTITSTDVNKHAWMHCIYLILSPGDQPRQWLYCEYPTIEGGGQQFLSTLVNILYEDKNITFWGLGLYQTVQVCHHRSILSRSDTLVPMECWPETQCLWSQTPIDEYILGIIILNPTCDKPFLV